MYLFHRINTKWLPCACISVLIFSFLYIRLDKISAIVLYSAIPVLFFIIIGYGLRTVLKDTEVSFQAFFHRPANIATLLRGVFVVSGLISTASRLNGGGPLLKWISVCLIILGYTADLLDGWLARREVIKPRSAIWGAWYDAESDALILFLSCVVLVRFSDIPKILLIPGLCRYFFGLLYSIFPSDFLQSKWYYWYSKTIAAVFESIVALLICTILLAGESSFLNKFLLFQINIFIPLAAFLVLSSFVLETIYRIRSVLSRVPPGYRTGILHSFIIYYRIPFRYRKMKKFYSTFINPEDIAFDVGAHLGNRTRIFLDLGAEVLSVEPQPACRGLLKLWFGPHTKAHLNFTAIGAKEKQVKMMLSSRNPTLSSTDEDWVREMKFKGIKWDDSYVTEVKTLDIMIGRYGLPKFIKIDTEGNEQDVLSGLSHPVEIISYEFLPSQKKRAKDCIKRLTNIGDYLFNYSPGESMKMSLSDPVTADRMSTIIDTYPAGGKSGDIYAVLQKTD